MFASVFALWFVLFVLFNSVGNFGDGLLLDCFTVRVAVGALS